MLSGIVLRSLGGAYDIDTEEGVRQAVLRGRLRLDERVGDRVVTGDRVRIAPQDQPDAPWTIEQVEERTSSLVRRAPGKAPRPKVIVANVDRILIVFAAARPEPHLRMLDRFLVLCESSALEPVVVVNKVDLVGEDTAREKFAIYSEIGYPVHFVSVAGGRGLEPIREILCSGISALTGPSGVGKSSILNCIEEGLQLRVGEVSDLVRKGRHTTVTAELIRLQCGGYVADTPGLRELGLWGVESDELDLLFPEFEDYLGSCKYGNSCSHSHEPGCAVLRAVEEGAVARSRYESYLLMLKGDEEEWD